MVQGKSRSLTRAWRKCLGSHTLYVPVLDFLRGEVLRWRFRGNRDDQPLTADHRLVGLQICDIRFCEHR